MNVTDYAIKQIIFSGWVDSDIPTTPVKKQKSDHGDLLKPIRQWLKQLQIKDTKIAHKICRLIPAQCPFATKIQFFGRTIVTIPPLCKINPFYDDLMELRFRAMCYLVDDCGEDVSQYC